MKTPLFPVVHCPLPSTAPRPDAGERGRILLLGYSHWCFCVVVFIRYRGIVPVFTQPVGSALESRACRHAPPFHALVSSYFPQIYFKDFEFPYRNVVPWNGKLSVPFTPQKIFLTLAIKIYVYKICILQKVVFSFFCKRQPCLSQKYLTIDLNLNSPFCLVSRRRRAWRVRSGYPRMTSPCFSRRACTSSPCPSSSTWRPTRWSSSSPSSRRSPSPSSGASSSGCAAGECVTSSVFKRCWWLVRVTLVVAYGFLPQNILEVTRTREWYFAVLWMQVQLSGYNEVVGTLEPYHVQKNLSELFLTHRWQGWKKLLYGRTCVQGWVFMHKSHYCGTFISLSACAFIFDTKNGFHGNDL